VKKFTGDEVEGVKLKGRAKQTWDEVEEKHCRIQRLDKRMIWTVVRWRKLMKDIEKFPLVLFKD